MRIQHNRGDIYLGNQLNLKNGQFFWSYVNKEKNDHSYSQGQLYIKDPSSTELLPIDKGAIKFQGFITFPLYKSDFLSNTNKELYLKFQHCRPGDFFIFNINNTQLDWNETFNKGDILLITDCKYEYGGKGFRDILKAFEYIRIPGSVITSTDLDTENLNEAINKLSFRLKYNGEISNYNEFNNAEKKLGYFYVITVENLSFLSNQFESSKLRNPNNNLQLTLEIGDFILWNSSKWEIIPNITKTSYIPNTNEIERVISFEDYHKKLLEQSKTIKEAIDTLNVTKAGLDSNGKIPYSELPEELRSGLVFKGKFYPIKDITGDLSDKNNQNDWPEITDKQHGLFWIVDCQGYTNIQYQDKDHENRILELNTSDWIIWNPSEQWFDVVDNSDRLSAIEVTIPNIDSNDKRTLVGTVGLASDGKIEIKLKGNQIILNATNLIAQDPNNPGKKHYLPMYTGDNDQVITPTLVHQDEEILQVDENLQVGNNKKGQLTTIYGNLNLESFVGASSTTLQDPAFIYSTTLSKPSDNSTVHRFTKLLASLRRRYIKSNKDEITVYLPDATSNLLAAFYDDLLIPNYYTKVKEDGYITDTLTADFIYNKTESYVNIGAGRLTAEDNETGEITFYSKTSDNKVGGFYTEYHSVYTGTDKGSNQKEHLLNRTKDKTHLVINPTVLEDEIETFVKMPTRSGTLVVWEDLIELLGNNGVPLMIPAWEQLSFREGTRIGLDTSPITIKINRPSHDNTKISRTNDLNRNYGEGIKSTWSYIGSNHENSLQSERGTKDDVVSFDSWLESQRSIATNESFIIPSTYRKDGNSKVNTETSEYTSDENETKKDTYGKNKSNGNYQRILPSRSIYPHDITYYDPYNGKLIPQDVKTKDVEMPAVGGVLLTSQSRIDGGTTL